ncbi:MAG TPA: phosphoribosylglycinamide formyltransferase [Rhodospirillaceae bacterium]|nr:phosphoribosylglycinamide formyltransferase [Rhodospirillaceae bacterium]
MVLDLSLAEAIISPPVRVGFLASHNGTAFRMMLERQVDTPVRIIPAVLITNNSGAACLGVATQYNVPSFVINKTTVGEENIDRTICDSLTQHKADCVVLAGYMKKIGAETLRAFSGRILNSHPALLPKFGGQGMYGRHVHEAVIAAGETESGVTVHLANEEYDTGPIVTQIKIPLSHDESAESLEDRIKTLEVDAYLQAIATLADLR